MLEKSNRYDFGCGRTEITPFAEVEFVVPRSGDREARARVELVERSGEPVVPLGEGRERGW